MIRITLLFLTFLILINPSFAGSQKEQSFSGEAKLQVGYRYLLSLPEGYDTDSAKKWPLLVFLHGAGERGDNLQLLKKARATQDDRSRKKV